MGAAVPKDLTPLPASVQGGSTTTAAHSSSGGGAFVRMIVGLFIVLAVIYGIYWLLKTYTKSKKSGGAGESAGGIDIVATTSLGPNRSLHLVRVGDELVLVGAAEQAITQLRVYDAEESRELEEQIDASTGSGGSGRSGWGRSGGKGKGTGTGTGTGTGKGSGTRRGPATDKAQAPTVARLLDELRKRTTR